MSPTHTLEHLSEELNRQGEDWRRVVETLEALDPAALIAVNPEVLDAVDEACRGPIRAAAPVPAGAIRA